MHTSTLLFTRGVVAQWVQRWTSDLEIAGCTPWPLRAKFHYAIQVPDPVTDPVSNKFVWVCECRRSEVMGDIPQRGALAQKFSAPCSGKTRSGKVREAQKW